MVADTPTERNTMPRSIRHTHWCWLANDVYDRFGPHLGADGFTLYIGLARYANHRTGKCWPSLERISAETGTPVERLEAVLPRLVALGLVAVEERPGRSPVFTLLAIPEAATSAPGPVEKPGVFAPTRDEQDLRTKQEEKESCVVSVEEGKSKETQSCSAPEVSTLLTIPIPAHCCVELSPSLTDSPYELSDDQRLAQCDTNKQGIASLFASIWPEEVAARKALRQQEAEAIRRHPHTDIIDGSCTVCGEILTLTSERKD